MKAGGGGKPPAGKLSDMINRDFGSYDAFRKEFANAANTAFGSGWAWLVKTPSGLKVRRLAVFVFVMRVKMMFI